jgi:hypothetical protein
MISMSVPGIVQILQKVLINLIFMDLMMTDQWQQQLFYGKNYDEIDNEALNTFIDENGYSSISLLKNLGSTIVYIEIYIVIWLIIGLLYLLSAFKLYP